MNFDLITNIFGYIILADIIALIISLIVHHNKYTEKYYDSTIGRTEVRRKRGAPRNIWSRIFGWLLPVMFIGYGALCAVSGIAQQPEFNVEKDGYILWWIVVVSILGFIMLILPVIIIRVIVGVVKHHDERIADKAINAQNKIEENKETELNTLKLKYKPVQCPYCGTMNPPKYTNCKNCGGVLPNVDNRLLDQ